MQVTDYVQSPTRASSLRALSILLELIGLTIPMVMKISLLIKTIQPHMSKYVIVCMKEVIFQQNSQKKLITLSKWLVRPASSHFCKLRLLQLVSYKRDCRESFVYNSVVYELGLQRVLLYEVNQDPQVCIQVISKYLRLDKGTETGHMQPFMHF